MKKVLEQNKNIYLVANLKLLVEDSMRAVEELIELASISVFFVMMAIWTGLSGNVPLV
jgi:hypothetical protein